VYMIRVFQKSMHNRLGEGVESRDVGRLELAVIAPITAVVVALGIYPQLVLDRSEEATTAQVEAAARVADESTAEAAPAPSVPPVQAPPQQVPVQPGQAPPQEVSPEQLQEVPAQP
jgi:hypothetical protein